MRMVAIGSRRIHRRRESTHPTRRSTDPTTRRGRETQARRRVQMRHPHHWRPAITRSQRGVPARSTRIGSGSCAWMCDDQGIDTLSPLSSSSSPARRRGRDLKGTQRGTRHQPPSGEPCQREDVQRRSHEREQRGNFRQSQVARLVTKRPRARAGVHRRSHRARNTGRAGTAFRALYIRVSSDATERLGLRAASRATA